MLTISESFKSFLKQIWQGKKSHLKTLTWTLGNSDVSLWADIFPVVFYLVSQKFYYKCSFVVTKEAEKVIATLLDPHEHTSTTH